MKRELKKTVSVAMPQELYDAIKQLAEEDSRSVPNYIRQILWEHIGK